VEPEELEPGDLQRTTASVSWLGRVTDEDFSAMTAGFGVNAAHGVVRHAVFGEYTRQLASTALSARAELVETEAWTGNVGSVTGGVMREVFNGLRLEALVGVNVTVYAVPEAVKAAYGRPVSFHGPQGLGAGGLAAAWGLGDSGTSHRCSPHVPKSPCPYSEPKGRRA
jgi:hypothetical protein